MKKSVALAVMMATLLSTGNVLAANQVNVNVDPGTTVNVNVSQPAKAVGEVANWEKGAGADIVEMGTGAVNPKFKGAQAKLMARRAAMVDCYRNLLQQVKELQVSADTNVEDLMATSDVVNTKISGAIKGAKIIEEGEEGSGENYYYWVRMSMPLFGSNSVAAAALPEVMKSTPNAQPPMEVTPKTTSMPKEEFKAVQQEVKSAGYSGIVIDATGKGLECTMAPQILDTNGRAVYGMENIDVNFAVSNGLVGYSKSMQDVVRAGNNPLVIKANGVKGGTNSVNPVNVVVSPEDADKILLAAQNNPNIFKSGAVVFVR